MSASLPSFPVDSGPIVFLEAYSAWVHPMKVRHAKSYWGFAVDGDAEAHSRVQEIEEILSDLHSDETVFEALAKWQEQPSGDALVDRQIRILAEADCGQRLASGIRSIQRLRVCCENNGDGEQDQFHDATNIPSVTVPRRCARVPRKP